MKILKNKKIVWGIAIVFGILLTVFGGGKLLIYVSIAIAFFIVGKSFADLKRLYDDYRLGLRINALQYSAKQFDELQTLKKQLEQDLYTANERIKLFRSTQTQSTGGQNFDHFTTNSPRGIRENTETN